MSLKINNRGPLKDIRVIEMGSLIAGPFCGQLMGDMGAEVVKIEPPGAGDPIRVWGRGEPVWWEVIARNKKSVSINLRVAEGQALARKLIAEADILIENFRPGALEAWGLGPDGLRRENPRLIVVRLSGYGQDFRYAGTWVSLGSARRWAVGGLSPARGHLWPLGGLTGSQWSVWSPPQPVRDARGDDDDLTAVADQTNPGCCRSFELEGLRGTRSADTIRART